MLVELQNASTDEQTRISRLRPLLGSSLLLSAFLGILALYAYAQLKSMERTTWILGLSKGRVAIGILNLILVFAMAGLGYQSLRNREKLARSLKAFAAVIRSENGIAIVIGLAISSALLLVLAVSFLQSPLLPAGDLFKLIYMRTWPLIYWYVALGLVTASLCVAGAVVLPSPGRFEPFPLISKSVIVISLLVGSTVHWSISLLAKHLRPIVTFLDPGSVPGIQLNQAIPMVILIVIACCWLMSQSRMRFRNLVVLVLVGCMVQLGFALIDEGVAALPKRIRGMEGHNEYAAIVSAGNLDIEDITSYETRYGSKGFLSTKPPGVLASTCF